MEHQLIIYPTDEGGVAIIVPNRASGLSIGEIAQKNVPKGKPFQVVSRGKLPEDREYRDAWEYTEK